MPSTVERRTSRRLPARSNRSSLEWWDGPKTRSEAARVVNISRGGALLEVAGPPPVGQRVFLRLESPAESPWICGRVVRKGPDSVGLRFLEPCPGDVFEAAVLGISFGHLLGVGDPADG